MTTIKYENFEDWMSLLKASDKEKKTVVYIDVIRTKPSEDNITMSVLFQFIGQNGMINSCNVSDDMPYCVLVPEWVFSMLSSEKVQKEEYEFYRLSIDLFDKHLHEEYEKAVSIIKGAGFNNIIMGLVQ